MLDEKILKLFNKSFFDVSASFFDLYKEEYKEARTSPIIYWVMSKFNWTPFWYQTIMLHSLLKYDNVAWRVGRQSGKSTCMALGSLYIALARPITLEVEEINYNKTLNKMVKKKVKKKCGAKIFIGSSAQNKAEKVFDTILDFLYLNDETSRALENKLITYRRSPYPTIKFPNGAFITARGPGENGDSVRGDTYDCLFIDEADYMPPMFWASAQATTVNTSRRQTILSSTIKGTRSYFYEFCKRHKDINFPTYLNPNFDIEKDNEYKAALSQEAYVHEIKSEWGSASNAVFKAEDVENARVKYDYIYISINDDYMKEIYKIAGTSEDQKKIMLALKKNIWDRVGCPDYYNSLYYIGADLGYSNDASEYTVFQNTTRDNHLKMIVRIHTEGLNYYTQAYLLILLDMIFKADLISIDKGNAGIAMYHIIETDPLFAEIRKIYKNKILPLAYNEKIIVGYENGDKKKPIYRIAKEFSTSIINNFLTKKQIVFPFSDNDLYYQFINHTYTITENGVKYNKGDDHIVDSVRFAMLAKALAIQYKPKTLPVASVGTANRY